MSTLKLNKIVASAFAALAISVVMSWAFVDSTRVTHGATPTSQGFVAFVSALVR